MSQPAIFADDILPDGWQRLIAPTGACGLGIDPATTTKAKSNPTGLALLQRSGADFVVRLVLRFKSSDERVVPRIVRQLALLPHGLRLRKVCIDASNEKFFASGLKRDLAGTVVVQTVVSGESVQHLGETYSYKTYLGNLLVNTLEDNHLLLPRAEWLRDDLRLVKRDRGGFTADPDADGNHADCFDAIKLGLFALVGAGSGPAMAAATPVGAFAGKSDRPGILNAAARFLGLQTKRYN